MIIIVTKTTASSFIGAHRPMRAAALHTVTVWMLIAPFPNRKYRHKSADCTILQSTFFLLSPTWSAAAHPRLHKSLLCSFLHCCSRDRGKCKSPRTHTHTHRGVEDARKLRGHLMVLILMYIKDEAAAVVAPCSLSV